LFVCLQVSTWSRSAAAAAAKPSMLAEASAGRAPATARPRLAGMSAETSPAPRRQRIAAYAVLLRGDADAPEVLLTRMSARTRIRGRWTLPGGGLDHGEEPRAAVRREVYEETGLHVEPGAVLDVHSTHYTGSRADGLVEDYHGIHLIFTARVLPESLGVAPHVVEEDGSTDLATWVPLDEAVRLELLGSARHALAVVRGEQA
jgi:8-oxo-dGTP diphosphatase